MKLRDIIIVFVAPTRKRKERELWLTISDAMNADWPEPIPGRNDENGAVKDIARDDLRRSNFEIFIFFRGRISCLGMDVLFLIDRIRDEVPKRPVSRGNKG